MYTRPMRYFFSASQSTLASVNFSAVALLCARRNRDCNWRVFSHFSHHHGDLVVLAPAEDRAAWAAGGSATSTVMKGFAYFSRAYEAHKNNCQLHREASLRLHSVAAFIKQNWVEPERDYNFGFRSLADMSRLGFIVMST